MRIQLNVEKVGLWFLDGREDLNMSFADPGPKDLDWNALTAPQKEYLRTALLQKKVLRLDSPDIPPAPAVESPPEKEEIPFRKEAPSAPDIEKMARVREGELKELEAKCKTVLRKRLPTIKSAIADSKVEDLPYLNRLLAMEQKKKKSRITVVKAIESVIERLTKEVQSNITGDGDTDLSKYTPKGLPPVEETETGETVEIQPDGTVVKR